MMKEDCGTPRGSKSEDTPNQSYEKGMEILFEVSGGALCVREVARHL
jgi:hypothetical protein